MQVIEKKTLNNHIYNIYKTSKKGEYLFACQGGIHFGILKKTSNNDYSLNVKNHESLNFGVQRISGILEFKKDTFFILNYDSSKI